MGEIIVGDCVEVLKSLQESSVACCITDPPYNYEFIGKHWDHSEIERRKNRVSNSKTLVKHVPYGSGLSGGVRNARWYNRNRENIIEYQQWVEQWGKEIFRLCKPGAYVAVFNATRTIAHVQIALEEAGFYARDMLVYRKPSGIPKGCNLALQLKKSGATEISESVHQYHSALRNEWEAIILVQKPLINNYLQTYISYNVGVMKTINPDGSFKSNIIENLHERNNDDFNVHCTVKPLPLMKYLVEMLVPPGESNIVLDPFAGSGTTLLAAKICGNGYIGIEKEPTYIPIIKKRLSVF